MKGRADNKFLFPQGIQLLLVLSIVFVLAYFILFPFRHSVSHYSSIQLWLSRGAVAFLLAYLTYQVLYKRIGTFLSQPLSPVNIAIFRIVYFSWQVAALVVANKTLASEVVRPYLDYTDSMRIPIPGIQFISMHIPVSKQILFFLIPICNISMVFSFLGLFTRISTKVYAACIFYICLVPLLYGKVVHSHHMVWFPAMLAFSNCGYTLSLDRLIGKHLLKKNYSDTPSVQFGLPAQLCLLLLGVTYFFPGFWKLWGGGFDWIFTLNLTKQMYVKWGETNGWLPFFRIDNYPPLIIVAAIVTIAFEFGFIFLIFYRKWRIPLMLTGILMHTGIYLFMRIPFFTILPIYVLLIDWGALFRKGDTIVNERYTLPVPKQYGLRILAGVLITGNIIFGFLKVSSYPFTCYPTFDYMVPDTMDYVRYQAYSHGKLTMQHAQLKKELSTRMPDYNLRALEYKVLDAYITGDTAQLSTLVHNIFYKPINMADSIVIYKAHGGISPEEAPEAVIVEAMYSIKQ